MPIIKSAIKRVRTSEKRRSRNAITRNRWKESVKSFVKLVEEGKLKEAAKMMPEVQKNLDMAAKKNVLPKKKPPGQAIGSGKKVNQQKSRSQKVRYFSKNLKRAKLQRNLELFLLAQNQRFYFFYFEQWNFFLF